MNYILKVTETNNKAGKFLYQIIDETGNVLTERRSNREYVAATINGACFFGRVDLVGKGDHKLFLKQDSIKNDPEAYKGFSCIAYKQ
jgi:hypothetical protein